MSDLVVATWKLCRCPKIQMTLHVTFLVVGHKHGGVLSNSAFGIALANAEANLPEPATLIDSLGKLPFALVGDDAFPLCSCLVRPYPGRNLTIWKRIFNYRLSHARRIVDNAFGILANQWRIFRTPIKASPESAERLSRPVLQLHNFLTREESSLYCPAEFVSCGWRDDTGRDARQPIT